MANIEKRKLAQRRWAQQEGAHLRRMSMYGLSREQFGQMLSVQNGKCAICNAVPDNENALHVDHDHATGMVRGLLCSACNHMLGNARDSVVNLESAIRYLSAAEQQIEINKINHVPMIKTDAMLARERKDEQERLERHKGVARRNAEWHEKIEQKRRDEDEWHARIWGCHESHSVEDCPLVQRAYSA